MKQISEFINAFSFMSGERNHFGSSDFFPVILSEQLRKMQLRLIYGS